MDTTHVNYRPNRYDTYELPAEMINTTHVDQMDIRHVYQMDTAHVNSMHTAHVKYRLTGFNTCVLAEWL